MTQIVPFKSFSLTNPDRIVIDLPSTRWPKIVKKVKKGRRILGYRFGQINPEKARLVIDFSVPTVIGRSFVLPASTGKPHRIVIEARHEKSMSVSQPKTNNNSSRVGNEIKRDTGKSFSYRKVDGIPGSVRPLIMIDPGHGGHDPGAIGAHKGHDEKLHGSLHPSARCKPSATPAHPEQTEQPPCTRPRSATARASPRLFAWLLEYRAGHLQGRRGLPGRPKRIVDLQHSLALRGGRR